MNDNDLENKIVHFFVENPTLWCREEDKYKINEIDIINTLRSPIAIGFLMIWSVFESRLTNGNMLTFNKIHEYSVDISNRIKNNNFDITDELNHFVHRYTIKDNHNIHIKHLFYKRDNEKTEFLKLLENERSVVNDIETIFSVVYRFRNNMFHGNKKVASWLELKMEINYCISFMIKVLNLLESA
ncbi:hypothetical protein [Anaerorhabdus furcosa]|uniref:Apea-like HEPN domain-containing protein n=1 Tax=Anaerorhabdus furcosa TaxID=118967 RepID=A0A1T4M0Y1_9FIRM|nr:hypothetical protein [Anaerorhabdus furcosa]SJZ60428.1 hypothetical protein SAMN02745191_1131 [Anaerorhabdus furcosa]